MPTVLKSGSLNLLGPSGPAQACNGIALKKLKQKHTACFYLCPSNIVITHSSGVSTIYMVIIVRKKLFHYFGTCNHCTKHITDRISSHKYESYTAVWQASSQHSRERYLFAAHFNPTLVQHGNDVRTSCFYRSMHIPCKDASVVPR